jgi:hypothetical protein
LRKITIANRKRQVRYARLSMRLVIATNLGSCIVIWSLRICCIRRVGVEGLSRCQILASPDFMRTIWWQLPEERLGTLRLRSWLVRDTDLSATSGQSVLSCIFYSADFLPSTKNPMLFSLRR